MIPVNDLKRQYFKYKDEFDQALIEFMGRGYYILGPDVENFEQRFAKLNNIKYCVGMDNGLNAISLGIRALGITKGDEVIVQANTYIATVLGITQNGATPIFVEPNEFYNIDPDNIEEKITKKTKAILVTHLYGQASNMGLIVDLCKKHNLYLLEDCAQSHFAKYKNQFTGTFGDMGFFSFYPTKNLGAFGDAGAVITNNQDLANKLKLLRNYGSVTRYENEIEGYNARLDSIQAVLLSVKLNHMDELIAERINLAKQYLDRIKNNKITLPKVDNHCDHIWHQFVIQVEDRTKFREYLRLHDVSTDVHYPTPPHLSNALKHLGYSKGDFPITEMMSNKVVSLPFFNGITQIEIDQVINVVNHYE